ncbi:MAG: hypothetical protein HOV71_28280 [Hamadaea sp.]|nr:hypothetical protein [Hamadaea sp.]NUR52042.1 hypothetical protein [Hamadaea sp.]NUT02339.1 hypothetical protein [Hamadaea sp.]
MTPLERRYRRLIGLYPAPYRQDRGEEIVGTLLDMSGDRRWPSVRETTGLVVGAVRTHARASRDRSAADTWRGGLRLAVLFLLLQSTVDAGASAGLILSNGATEPSTLIVGYCAATMLSFAALLATASRRYLVGVGLTAAVWFFEQIVIHGRMGGPMYLPGEMYFWPITLAVLAGLPLIWLRPPGGRRWPWAVAVVPAVLALPSQFEATLGPVQALLFLLTLMVCLAAAVVDPRVSIGAAGWPVGYACYLVYAIVAWDAPAYFWVPLSILLAITAALLLADPVRRLSRRSRPERTT